MAPMIVRDEPPERQRGAQLAPDRAERAAVERPHPKDDHEVGTGSRGLELDLVQAGEAAVAAAAY
jgi:hypothetical protein